MKLHLIKKLSIGLSSLFLFTGCILVDDDYDYIGVDHYYYEDVNYYGPNRVILHDTYVAPPPRYHHFRSERFDGPRPPHHMPGPRHDGPHRFGPGPGGRHDFGPRPGGRPDFGPRPGGRPNFGPGPHHGNDRPHAALGRR